MVEIIISATQGRYLCKVPGKLSWKSEFPDEHDARAKGVE